VSELDEVLEIIDDNNNVVGSALRRECYEKGLLHRAVNIFIFNSEGQVFLHKRSDKKFKFPSFWDLSCSEHVKPGESFEETAKRGLKEELNIEVDLEEIIPIHHIDSADERGEYHDNELVVTYKGTYDRDMRFDPNEVAEGKFFNIEELDKLIKNGEIQVTSWFLEDWKILTDI